MGESELKPQPEQPVPSAGASENNNGKGKTKRTWLLWLGTLGAAVLLYWGLGYLALGLTHESTDDAFIEGHIVAIAPQISGPVAKVLVQDNQEVKKGDLLVEIDPSDYDAAVRQRGASIDTARANLKAVLSVLELMAAKVTTAEAAAKQAHAQAAASRATCERAQADLKRAEPLFRNGTISSQDYDAAIATARESEATLKADEESAAAADSRVTEARATWTATGAGVDLARAQVTQAQTDSHTAELDLSYTKIYAPKDGRVTRKSVEPGSYVQTGQALMAVVPRDVWVVANFKETQLADIRPGQPVELKVDAFPGTLYRGHVDSIQSGSGTRFSLLPPENAAGNFVKVVQRVPVKILFDQQPDGGQTIGPGMSVMPWVQVKGYSIPKLVVLAVAVVLAFLGMGVFRIVLARVNHKLTR